MNPIGIEGDIYLEPLNMKPAGTETVNPKEIKSDVHIAHREMIEYQWQRVLRGLINTKKPDYKKQKERALDILYNPLYAFGSLRGLGQIEIKNRLTSFLDENINETHTYKMDDVGTLTDMTIERIGGNNHAL